MSGRAADPGKLKRRRPGREAVRRLDAWLAQAPGRAYQMSGDRHVLREAGTLLASSRSLAAALDAARRAEP